MNLSQLGATQLRLSPLMAAILGSLLISTLTAALYAYRSFVSPLVTDPASRLEWRVPTAVNVSTAISASNKVDTQTLTRPIFSKSRRPSPRNDQQASSKAPATLPPPPLPPGLSLKAIVILGKNKNAFVVCNSLPDGKWMKEGETIQGWTITTMHDLNVILKNGDHSARLALDYAGTDQTPVDTPVSKTVSDPDFVTEARGRRG